MQHRLHKRYVKLKARGKRENKAIVAVARELSAFLWELQNKIPLSLPPSGELITRTNHETVLTTSNPNPTLHTRKETHTYRPTAEWRRGASTGARPALDDVLSSPGSPQGSNRGGARV